MVHMVPGLLLVGVGVVLVEVGAFSDTTRERCGAPWERRVAI